MNKLIIISNRLPINITKVEGKLHFEKSVGGLATALSSLRAFPKKVWMGWPGIVDEELNEIEKTEIITELKKFGCIPIFLNQEKIDKYYYGFSNKTIWPLFHYFPLYTDYNQEYWESYKEVNKRFCNEILKFAKQGDDIWIHDYHLMLLPNLLREYLPDSSIGFFLHIPFPSSELFRQLPYRKEILEGMLGADLIGFHTYDYAGHFNESVRRILGYEHVFSQINTNERVVYSDIFPIGINYNKYSRAKKNKRTKRIVGIFRKKFKDRKIIVSIDRLDYSKGIPNRIEAYEYFLELYPEYREKVSLIMCAVPSRTQVDTYTQLKYKVDELVGRVNGKFGNIHWTPIYYLYRSLPFEEISGLYNLADIAMVTPIRDGMNLVAKEFIAAKTDAKGVLILSESAGASQELGEAVIVNSHDKREMAEAIKKALEMPIEKQISSNRLMQERLKRYDISRWASDFLDRLNFVIEQREIFKTTYLAGKFEESLIEDYIKSKQRMLLLDYDGTLVGFYDKPELAMPDNELLNIIEKLSAQKGNSIVIISGRDRNTMDSWFSKLNLTLVAEHGVWIKDIGKDWKTLHHLKREWKKEITPILELFVDRTPLSFLEEKDYSLVWHYRNVNTNLASNRVNELKNILANFTVNLNIGFLEGNKVLEIKNLGINKGAATTRMIRKQKPDFIISVGDDLTDEDMFAVLDANAYSIRIGNEKSKAKFHLKSYKDVRVLLKKLGDY